MIFTKRIDRIKKYDSLYGVNGTAKKKIRSLTYLIFLIFTIMENYILFLFISIPIIATIIGIVWAYECRHEYEIKRLEEKFEKKKRLKYLEELKKKDV